MKKILFILSLVFLSSVHVFAQDDDNNDASDKIRDKMREFIQQRLNLSKNEAEKFTPIFIQYFREWRSTIREFRPLKDPLLLKQKVIELQLRYRNNFKEVLGEQRSNDVFKHQQKFIEELRELKLQRQRENQPPARRFR